MELDKLKSANGFIIIKNVKVDNTRASGYVIDQEDDFSNYKIMTMASAEVVVASHDTVMLNKEQGYAEPICQAGDTIFFDANQLIKFSLKDGGVVRGTFHKHILAVEPKKKDAMLITKKSKGD